MNKGGHEHFILAGSPRLTSQIKHLLPKHLADKLVDSISTSGGDRLSDIVKMAVTMFTKEEEQELRAVVEKLMDEIHANSFGVVGITGTLRVISALLETLPPEERENSKRDLVSYCAKVAEVSGGFIGFLGSRRRVCTEERERLARIAAELESSHQESARQIING